MPNTRRRKANRFLNELQFSLVVCLTAALLAASVSAEDWPTYRHDAARSGITSE